MGFYASNVRKASRSWVLRGTLRMLRNSASYFSQRRQYLRMWNTAFTTGEVEHHLLLVFHPHQLLSSAELG